MPKTWSSTGPEAEAAYKAMCSPLTYTWGQWATAGVFMMQVTGAFCLGEVLGRQGLIGYPVKDVYYEVHAHHAEEAHAAAWSQQALEESIAETALKSNAALFDINYADTDLSRFPCNKHLIKHLLVTIDLNEGLLKRKNINGANYNH